MADEKKAPPAAAPPPVDALATFAQEYDEDRKKLRWALIIAIIVHVGIFLIHLPEIVYSEPKKAEKAKVYVVQQLRFKPPPPQQQQELLKPRTKKIPIPDPTPDEPEPIRIVDEVDQPDLDIPVDDSLIGIPEGPPPSAEPTGPIEVGGNVRPPEKISYPQPAYTEIARKARIQGVVIVQAIIDKQGNVTNVKVLKGLPMGLEEAAVEAIKTWKFKPATLNGKPVAVYYNLTVNFKLQ